MKSKSRLSDTKSIYSYSILPFNQPQSDQISTYSHVTAYNVNCIMITFYLYYLPVSLFLKICKQGDEACLLSLFI